MGAVEGREPGLAALGRPLPVSIPDARPVGTAGQLVPPYELALADFARHLSLSARQRTAGAYLDTLQRLVAFELDPLQADRGDLERFLSRSRRGGGGGWQGRPSPPAPTPGLGGPRRLFPPGPPPNLRPGGTPGGNSAPPRGAFTPGP